MNSILKSADPTIGCEVARARHFGGPLRRIAASLTVFVAIGLTIAGFSDVVQDLDYEALVRAMRHMPAAAIGWSICATILSFAALVARDVCAVRYVGGRTPLLAPFLAGFCGTALGNAVGFGTLTGAAVRYRIYGAVGIRSRDIARLLLFIAGGFGLGLAGFGGFAGLMEPVPVAHLLGWRPELLRLISAMALSAAVAIVFFGPRGTLRIGAFSIAGPSRMLTAAQLLLAATRLTGAAAALWILLPGAPIDFLTFAAVFSAATALGAVSNLPGGIGVFEAVVLWALKGQASPDSIAAALLTYRGIYFAVPLALSAALLAIFETRLAIGHERSRDDRLVRAAAGLAPRFMGVISFAAGVMLLISGATPTFGHRLAILSMRLPLWIVETSHFLGSLLGLVFLFVARGLFERRDGAWWIALALAIASLGLSLAKGLAYGEAGFLSFLIALLLTTRRQFDRPASMLEQPFTIGWFVAVAVILVAAQLIFFLAFRDVDYTAHDLWWQFEFDAQAPRALRALLGAAVIAIAFGLWELLRPPKGLASPPDAAALAHASRIIDLQGRSESLLAMMGDKSLLFSTSGKAFIMYGKRGRSWIALFDPVGPCEEWTELIRRFIGLADGHGGRAAFYQIRPESLPYYLDAGLTVMKLGEEACVPLTDFSLQGGAKAHLRYALKRGERDGLTFELVPPDRVTFILAALETISSDWLETRRNGEKGFSVAAFEPRYLESQWVALVRQHGVPTSFVTVMTTSSVREASTGLMRHARGTSPYAMEFLFTNLMLQLKELNCRCLSLGMAPLSGIESPPLSSRWNRLGAIIRHYGSPFYNFRGLRLFKDKFNPIWEPRYLAASGTLSPFMALADATTLIGRGFKRPKELSNRE
ncbi:bifunctional lysylphosphatidylglycerol flippase/synthetase MprF [Mesorhizobium sp. B2-1-8]|uniref:bifunctional lysylphosphatidylglycerol flippase/synthetase MprF n=1 Tax=Mesorhizobium sp. B2-1-8 TaxID=2589967 RepID=UPI001D11874D|nr:bifunctional lysylphosphatidylglycerol flippase/synthetase MprF [Mesorhizobium sp. B2-1-8]UCI21749.1 bifunctional lysylphosphatidylglycerol flippase/synthetase MprF [Mesorhizobium sp. B2-1-8]